MSGRPKPNPQHTPTPCSTNQISAEPPQRRTQGDLTRLGWMYYNHSLYFISTAEKNWTASRDYCLERDADLIVINSREEQEFVGRLRGDYWIGLSDGDPEGTWKWVDGTIMTSSSWGPRQPDDNHGGEDCVATLEGRGPVTGDLGGSWHDVPCAELLLWICEKVLVLDHLESDLNKEDVDCWVVNVDYVHCQWKPSASPDVNYTFYSRFDEGYDEDYDEDVSEVFSECARYVQNATHLGCDHPYEDLWMKRFSPYVTKLMLGNQSFPEQTHNLKAKVRLNAPFNLTVKIGPDSNLWWYWNQTHEHGCIESEVRHRTNGKNWETNELTTTSYCINLPRSKRYELQVRIRVKDACVESDWSDWCPPVFWGPTEETNGTESVLSSRARVL
ncbi:CD209 antigen-like protein D [Merluccius polli]|uniref:CD209 antigen-like protein D n=1 Tax=Merluccius polli TaxID=89951 RepID=A0AA47PBS6_MERPO|nr:CD209 antigen-like protein D [Merluccius polli]